MQNENPKPNFEFIALMAALMSVVALCIDALLPAISYIGDTIGSYDTTEHQLLITMIFLGLGVGQLLFGPLSDSFGRKPMVIIGFAIFFVASVVCILSVNLEMMIIGRIFQGIGLSAARTLSISIIRDIYSGDYMARIMSFVTAFFILVPVVAPAIGKTILDAYGWQAIFYMQLIMGFVVMVWFWKRQPETLHPEYKVPFSRHEFTDGFKEFIKHRDTVAFTLISGLCTGAFLVYLSASQHVFEEQYGLVDEFPYIFATLAVSIGLSTFLNGTMVMRFGMRKLAFTALSAFCAIAMIYVLVFWGEANPPVWLLVVFLSFQFFCLGFMWGNFRSIAMEPVGHIAGIAAAINGFFSTIISIPIASFIGKFVDHTVLPMFIGLAICGFLSLAVFLGAGRRGYKDAKGLAT